MSQEASRQMPAFMSHMRAATTSDFSADCASAKERPADTKTMSEPA